MWFRNCIVYQLTKADTLNAENLEAALDSNPFVACRSGETSRSGWVSASDGLSEQLVHTAGGFHRIMLRTEEKILPSSVINDVLDDKVKQIEEEQDRKVYRKERQQLKEEVIFDLLPRAFSRFNHIQALIAPEQGWIFIDSSNHKRADLLLNKLREALGSLNVRIPTVNNAPSAIMSSWLTEVTPLPTGITVLDSCELRDTLVESGVIRIKGQVLQDEEFTSHLESGKQVVKLMLSWQEQLNFMLQEDLSIKGLKISRENSEDDQPSDDPMAIFDSETVEIGLELSALYPEIFNAFGGIVES